jgi:hypothetical protein
MSKAFVAVMYTSILALPKLCSFFLSLLVVSLGQCALLWLLSRPVFDVAL